MSPLAKLLFSILESEDSVDYKWGQLPDEKQTLLELAAQVIAEAKSGSPEAREDMIRSLYLLQDDIFRHPLDKSVWNADHPVLYGIRYDLEQAWEQGPLHQSLLNLDELPEEPAAFAKWLKQYCQQHEILNHPLFNYLLEEGRFDDFKQYVGILGPLEVPQTELYARATVGLPDESVRIEISKNYWDEMGLGDPDGCHSAWAIRFANALDIYDDTTPWSEQFMSIPVDVIERFVVSQAVSARRKNWLKVIGHLGATELFDPVLNVTIVKIGRRFDLSDFVLEYFINHIKLDAIHGADWLKKVVVPICEELPEARFEIARGAELNLRSAQYAYDAIFELIRAKAATRA